MQKPNDPVIDFILDPSTYNLVKNGSDSWPYSRMSASRLEKIGYRLIALRCTQLGLERPTRDEASKWYRGR